MTTEKHIERIGTGLPHKCYHWRFLAEHTLPRVLKVMAISLLANCYFIYTLIHGLWK